MLFKNSPQQWSGAREFDCLPLGPGSSVPGLVTLDILLNLSGLRFPLCRLGVSNCICPLRLGISTVWHAEPSNARPPHWWKSPSFFHWPAQVSPPASAYLRSSLPCSLCSRPSCWRLPQGLCICYALYLVLLSPTDARRTLPSPNGSYRDVSISLPLATRPSFPGFFALCTSTHSMHRGLTG